MRETAALALAEDTAAQQLLLQQLLLQLLFGSPASPHGMVTP